MYAVSKNHVSKKLEVHRSNEYYMLHDEDTTFEKWEPPTDGLVTAAIQKAHFGIASKTKMTLHSILALGDDEEELKNRISRDHPNRIPNRKRVSVDNAECSILLSTLKAYDGMKSNARGSTKRQVKHAKNDAKLENTKDVVNKKKSKLESTTLMNEESKLESTTTLMNQESKEVEGGDDLFGPDNEITCDGRNCTMTEFFKGELATAQARIVELQSEVKTLHETNNRNVEDFTKQLAVFNKKLKSPQKNRQAARSGNSGTCFLENINGWTGACMINDEDVPSGQIHFGENIFVESKKIATDVEATSMEMRKRVMALLKLVYPNDLLRRSLDVTKVDFPDPLPISPTTVTVMTTALEKMAWDGDNINLTRSSISEAVRRLMHAIRTDAKVKSLAPEEQAALKKAKAEKVRAARILKKEQEKEAKKNKQKKNKKVLAINSDDSEEEEEEEEEN